MIQFFYQICPVCQNGRAAIVKIEGRDELILLCHSCKSAWMSYEDGPDPAKAVDVKAVLGLRHLRVRDATREEIVAAGWPAGTLDLHLEESKSDPADWWLLEQLRDLRENEEQEVQLASRHLELYAAGKPVGDPVRFASSTLSSLTHATAEIAYRLVHCEDAKLNERYQAMITLVALTTTGYPLYAGYCEPEEIRDLIVARPRGHDWPDFQLDLIVSILWLYERRIPELSWAGMLDDMYASLQYLSRMFKVPALASFDNVRELIGQTELIKAAILKRNQEAAAKHFEGKADHFDID